MMTPPSRPIAGHLALIGSGEFADAMAETHRTLMARLEQPVRPVFVDTLAGFESNIDGIDHKARAYFRRNFGLELAVARYRTGRESAAEIAAAVGAISQATYILAGPGSPSYGIRVLRESAVWRAIEARWREGATVVFASAAALIVGGCALPVYEIFKAGHDVAWIPGLDLLSALGLHAAVVPHWNTTSGDGYDTRFCYMGAARFAVLERQLDPAQLLLGIDEYTGLCLEPDRRGTVLGIGQVTVRQRGRQMTWIRGQPVTLDTVGVSGAPVALGGDAAPSSVAREQHAPDEGDGDADILALRAGVGEALERGDVDAAIEGMVALSIVAGAGLDQALPGRTELAVQTLQLTLPQLVQVAEADRTLDALSAERDALVDLLVAARATLRQAGEWAGADRVRARLTELGYVLADAPTGTTWSYEGAARRRSTPPLVPQS